jgi:excisionase family DNA binding protein
MSICSTAQSDVGPLVATVREAARKLRCSRPKIYGLIAEGKLESYLDGNIRKITTRSIHAHIERQLKDAKSATPALLRRIRQLRNQPAA